MRALDTSPDAREVQLAIQRGLGPQARFELAVEMSKATRKLAEAGIRQRHPGYSDRKVKTELICILYGMEGF